MEKATTALTSVTLVLAGACGYLGYRISRDVHVIDAQWERIEELERKSRLPMSSSQRANARARGAKPQETMSPPVSHRKLSASEVHRARMIVSARERANALKDPSNRAALLAQMQASFRSALARLPAWLEIPDEIMTRLAELKAQQYLRSVEQSPELHMQKDPQSRAQAIIQAIRTDEAEIAGLLGPERYERWKEYHHDTEFARRQLWHIYAGTPRSAALTEEKTRQLARILSEALPSPNALTIDLVARNSAIPVRPDAESSTAVLEQTRRANATIRARAQPLLSHQEFEILDRWMQERLEQMEVNKDKDSIVERVFGKNVDQ